MKVDDDFVAAGPELAPEAFYFGPGPTDTGRKLGATQYVKAVDSRVTLENRQYAVLHRPGHGGCRTGFTQPFYGRAHPQTVTHRAKADHQYPGSGIAEC